MSRGAQRGVSLVELMVTLVIGMLISAAMLYIFLGSHKSFQTNDASARILEEGRYGLEVLAREIRMAGYTGCANLLDVTPNVIADPDKDGDALEHVNFGKATAIRVFDNGSGWINPTTIARVAGTDVIRIQRLGPEGLGLTGNLSSQNANIQILENPYGWAAGKILIITDCTAVDIFAATNVSSGAGKVTIAHANSSNTDNNLSKAYGADAQVMGYEERTFFVGVHPSTGLPTLYQILYDGATSTPTEIAANVYDLQATLGLDADGDGDADSTGVLPAAVADWAQVVSANVVISLRSEADKVAPTLATYSYAGSTVSDYRIRRDFATTVGIRNRLP